jgi:hypothetical protein
LLTSIALTNEPFIQGMDQLAASRQAAANGAGEQVDARRWYFDAAETPLEVVSNLKELFGLRETDSVVEVVAEISKIQQWLESDIVPLGVDVDEIIGAMKKILNLPALRTAAEVLAEASTVTSALLADQAGVSAPGTEAAESPSTNEGDEDMTLLKKLAAALQVREGDDEVIAEVTDLVNLRASIKEKLDADKDSTKVLLSGVSEVVEAQANLGVLHESLGATKQTEATDAVVVLLEKAKKWDEAEAELTELRQKVADEEKVKAEADVDEVIKAHKLPKQVRPALLLERTTNPVDFAKRFPPLGDNLALTQPQVAGGDPPLDPPPEKPDAEVIDLTSYPGRNATNRMMKWVKGNVKGADKWVRDDVWTEACRRLDAARKPDGPQVIGL